jgi:hypothetical protein
VGVKQNFHKRLYLPYKQHQAEGACSEPTTVLGISPYRAVRAAGFRSLLTHRHFLKFTSLCGASAKPIAVRCRASRGRS